MNQWVEVSFDCLPLRSVTRLDVPLDASPKYRRLCERVKAAIEKHGTHNTYYLYEGSCTYHLTNSPELGMIQFAFHGVVFTDAADAKAERCAVDVELARETCDWLTEPIVRWLRESVTKAVMVEFERYIEAGDLAQTQQRIAKIQAASDAGGGFVGMYL